MVDDLEAEQTVCLVGAPASNLPMPVRLLEVAGLRYSIERLVPYQDGYGESPIWQANYATIVIYLDGREQGEIVSALVQRAQKLDVPVVLLAANRTLADELPPLLNELPVIFADGDDEAIAERLRATTQFLGRKRHSAVENSLYEDLPYEEVVVRAPRRRHSGPSRVRDQGEVERVLQKTVERAKADVGWFMEEKLGARIVPRVETGRWDVAVWVDALPSPALNPVLVKYAHQPQDKDDLWASLTETRLFLALLVVDHADPSWEVGAGCAIVTIGVDRLAEMNKRQFGRLLVQGRNRLVHS